MKVKGGKGVRPPVKEIAKNLAKHVVVIKASEYRTSKCCGHCGSVLTQLGNRKSFCTQKHYGCRGGHKHRDIDAAWKIGARLIASAQGKELGAFDPKFHASELSEPGDPSPPEKVIPPRPQLLDAINDYRAYLAAGH
jgi:transposase